MTLNQFPIIVLLKTLITLIVWTMPHSTDYCSSDLKMLNLLISTLWIERVIIIFIKWVLSTY